jgi:hypothetical protein
MPCGSLRPITSDHYCSTRNVSNVLTEDQCRGLSTIWFILLKEKTIITQGHYESFSVLCNTSHSVGHRSSFIASRIDSSLYPFMVSPSLLGPNWLFLLGLRGPGPFPPFLQTGSRKLWTQATARFPVRHNYSTWPTNHQID